MPRSVLSAIASIWVDSDMSFLIEKCQLETKRKIWREATHKYQQTHPKQIQEKNRKWKQTHPEYARNWRISHHEQINESSRRYYQNHPERQRKASEKYYWSHLEKIHERTRKYYQSHHEQMRESNRRWQHHHPERPLKYYYAHREQMRQTTRNWQKTHPAAMKLINAKVKARRKRDLPTTHIIGLPTKGFVLHHMAPEIAIWIPEGLHKSIPHRMSDPESMKRINGRAMEWSY